MIKLNELCIALANGESVLDFDDDICKLISINTDTGSVYVIGKNNKYSALIEDIKLIKRPLSHLTKQIKVEGYNNGEEFVPIEEIKKYAPLGARFGFAIEVDKLGQIGLRTPDSWLNPKLTYDFINKLHEWNFWLGDQSRFSKDIIDINTLIRQKQHNSREFNRNRL